MNAIDKLAQLITGPQNAARPPRPAPQPVVEAPQQAPPGSIVPLDAAQMTKAERRELIPTIVRPTADQLRNVPNADMATIAEYDAVLRAEGYRPPKDVITKLDEMDAPAKRLHTAIEECTRGVGARYHAHLDILAKRVASGDLETHAQDAWSRSDFESDSRERMGAFKSELINEVLRPAWVIAEPALKEKADFADAVIDRLEDEERQRWDRFHVPYRVPLWIAMFRRYAASLRDGSRQGAGMPSAMIAGL